MGVDAPIITGYRVTGPEGRRLEGIGAENRRLYPPLEAGVERVA